MGGRRQLGLAAAVVAATLPACSVAADEGPEAAAENERLARAGVHVDVPRGWHGRIAQRWFPLAGAVEVVLATFPLPARTDLVAWVGRRHLRTDDAAVVVAEALPGTDLPAEPARVAPGERRRWVDRFFRARGRAFMLHVAFGSAPPPAKLVAVLNGVLGRVVVERRRRSLRAAPDPAPAAVFAPPRLLAGPVPVVRQCRRAQARAAFPVLCPTRLPRPFIGWPRGSPPHFRAELLRRGGRGVSGVDVGYGAPWEPGSGPDWRLHLWRNRPCCFLHFDVFRRPAGRSHVPQLARPAVLAGRRGLLADATSLGLSSESGDYLYFPNHTRFLWRERGVRYVATLHRFGTLGETRTLLARLIRTLRPARAVRP